MTCPVCGRPAEATLLPEQPMASGELVLRVAGLAVAACPDDHRTLLPVDLAARATAEVRARLLEAAPSRLWRRHPRCAACGDDLVLPPRRTDTPVPMDLDGQVVTVVVEADMARCPACGREQLLPGTGDRVGPVLEAVADHAVDA